MLGISPRETTFAARGFLPAEPRAQVRLERIAGIFLDGYHAAVESGDLIGLSQRLSSVELELQGFAWEGAAMGLALLDLLTPWNRDRHRRFLAGPGQAHAYMVHVGAGFALARLHRDAEKFALRLDPLLRWLVLDGYGFHEGYFRTRAHFPPAPRSRFHGHAARCFDQGLGRSLWFVAGADVQRVAATVAAFPEERRGDLWSGAGLACAYAGGVERAAVERLREAGAPFRGELAQGAAFAAKVRERARNPAAHTELACRILCGVTASAAAAATDAALACLPADGAEPAYEVWRRRVQESFAATVAG
jgi:hypothetical protein